MLLRYEALQHLRDPVTIAVMVAVPIVLYPTAAWVGHRVIAATAAEDDARVLDVGQEPRFATGPGLRPVELVDHESAVREGRVLASARLGNGSAELWWDSRSADSALAAERLRASITAHRRATAGLQVVVVDRQPVGGAARPLAARLAPVMLCFSLVTAALYTALDVVTGERERGTLETLVVSARERGLVVAAKFLVVVVVTLLGGLLAWAVGAGSLAVVAPGGLDLLAFWGGTALLLPLAVLVAAVMVVGAAWVPDFKSGQVLTLPLVVIPLSLAAAAALPGLVLGPVTAFLPVTGIALAMRDVVAGTASLPMVALASLATVAHAAAAVVVAARLLGREDVVTGTRGSAARRARGDYRPEALVVLGGAALALWFLGQPAQAADRTWGVVFTQVACVLPAALAAPWWLGLPPNGVLRFHRPRARDAFRGVAVGLCLPGLALAVGGVQARLLPAPASLLAGAVDATLPLPLLLVAFAILPAVCEELLFRGTFHGLWARAGRPWAAVLASAVAFGAIHLSVFRFAPTMALGLVLGALALRTGSIVPGMLAHAVNNGAALLAMRAGCDLAPGPLAWLAAALAVALAWPGVRGGGRAPGASTLAS